MEVAQCTLDKMSYSAFEFSKLSDLNTKRRSLVCEDYKKPAYFKKASKNGQSACFGARPHESSCKYALKDSKDKLRCLTDDEKKLIYNVDEIKINFDSVSSLKRNTKEVKNINLKFTQSSSENSNKNKIRKDPSNKAMGSILIMLLNDPNFAKSKNKIDIGEKYSYNANTIFRKFDELKGDDIDKTRGVYGQLLYIQKKIKDNTLWLNFGNFASFSIMVPDSLEKDFFNKFENYKNDIDELNGKYVLCFGTINKSKNDKFYLELNNLSKIVFK